MSAMENNYYPVNHQGFTTFVRFAMHNSGNVKIKKQTYEETEEIVVLCDIWRMDFFYNMINSWD